MNPADIKLEGSKAYKRKDYVTAVKLYSMAANHCPDDATLFSNRSLCWLKMGEGDRALMDAQLCKMKRPGWAKACYLQGSAQMLLKDYEKACDAFLDGLKLDPANVEIENSLWEAINCLEDISHCQKVVRIVIYSGETCSRVAQLLPVP
uniref:Serine/threonine-protein kinase BSK1-like TPR repeats domain-containing protein n=1 Tax=Arundo donax TaxID=35708 RepID=A0A0A8Y4H2_ARUDO